MRRKWSGTCDSTASNAKPMPTRATWLNQSEVLSPAALHSTNRPNSVTAMSPDSSMPSSRSARSSRAMPVTVRRVRESPSSP